MIHSPRIALPRRTLKERFFAVIACHIASKLRGTILELNRSLGKHFVFGYLSCVCMYRSHPSRVCNKYDNVVGERRGVR